ncbi:hypothetical protein [Halorubellus salinus]|nr:hypothetical protein [Halorubellus salinus]
MSRFTGSGRCRERAATVSRRGRRDGEPTVATSTPDGGGGG